MKKEQREATGTGTLPVDDTVPVVPTVERQTGPGTVRYSGTCRVLERVTSLSVQVAQIKS